MRRNSQVGTLVQMLGSGASACQSVSILTSFQGNIPSDAPCITTMPGEPAIGASTSRSFNIMGKDSFKKLMKDGYYYQGQQNQLSQQCPSVGETVHNHHIQLYGSMLTKQKHSPGVNHRQQRNELSEDRQRRQQQQYPLTQVNSVYRGDSSRQQQQCQDNILAHSLSTPGFITS